MVSLTFLKGVHNEYSPSKTFQVSPGSSAVEVLSSYDIGSLFIWKHNIIEPKPHILEATLKQAASAECFQIYGAPAPNLEATVARKKSCFPPIPTNLLILDIDKQPLPQALQDSWTDFSPATSARIICGFLDSVGLGALAQYQFCFAFSSSQLSKTILSCHLYFFMQESVELHDLRKWATVVNEGAGYKLLDPAVYKSVQPIYLCKPICRGFTDPIPHGSRIGSSTTQSEVLVPFLTLQKIGLERTSTQLSGNDQATIAALYEATADPIAQNSMEVRHNWLETLEAFAGRPDRGINEPAYRAAAQLVQEQGAEVVKADLDRHVEAFYRSLWRAVKSNGPRGGTDDQNIYTRDKIKGYIESAIDKDFGDRADALAGQIRKAMEEAIRTGSPVPLTTRDVLRAIEQLKVKHFTQWSTIRLELSNKVRKLISLSSLENQAKLVGLGDFKEAAKYNNGRDLVKAVLSKITLMQCGNLWYIRTVDKRSILGYSISRYGAPQADRKIHTLITEISGEVPDPRVKQTVLTYLAAGMQDPDRGENGVRIEKNCMVGEGVYWDRANATAYQHVSPMIDYNTLAQVDMTAVIDRDGVRYVPTTSTQVFWADGVRSDVQYDSPLSYSEALKFFSDHIQKLVCCDDISVPSLVALGASSLVQSPVRYLGLFTGPAGAGKTTGMSLFRHLIDQTVPDKDCWSSSHDAMPKDDKDVYALLSEQRIVCFDNITFLTKPRQGIFSIAATGGRVQQRILYSSEYAKHDIGSNIFLSCTADPITAPDLKQRTLTIDFSKVNKSTKDQTVDRFIRLAPRLRHALHVLTSQYLRMIEAAANNGLQDVNVREIMPAIMETMLDQGISVEAATIQQVNSKIREHATLKMIKDLEDESLFLMFLAFLNDQHTMEIRFTFAERYNMFISWIRANMHQKKFAPIAHNNIYTHLPVAIDILGVPDNKKSFDMLMSGYEYAMPDIAGWRVSRKWDGKQRRLTYKHKFAEFI